MVIMQLDIGLAGVCAMYQELLMDILALEVTRNEHTL